MFKDFNYCLKKSEFTCVLKHAGIVLVDNLKDGLNVPVFQNINWCSWVSFLGGAVGRKEGYNYPV